MTTQDGFTTGGIVGSGFSFAANLSMATGLVHISSDLPFWVPYVLTSVFGCIPVVVGFLLRKFDKK